MAERTAHELVPLELAARTLYQRVYEERHRRSGITCTPEQLNGIAYAVAALLPLFTSETGAAESVRRLRKEELVRGLFRDGGRSMIFLDGRAPLVHLAVPADGLERVAQALSAAYNT